MKIFNKVLVSILAGLFLFPLCFTYARFQFIQDDWSILKKAQTVPEVSVDDDQIEGKIDEGSNKLSGLLDGILHFPQRTEYATPLGYATRLIQVAINWTLGILSFVALVYMLYCGFLIFSSGSEDKNVQKGKKGISTAAIALAGIGLSWLIVSAMIWFLRLMTNSN